MSDDNNPVADYDPPASPGSRSPVSDREVLRLIEGMARSALELGGMPAALFSPGQHERHVLALIVKAIETQLKGET